MKRVVLQEWAIVFSVFILLLISTSGMGAVIYVDDDAVGDPGPGNPLVSDPFEDGSAENPFDAIQEAIDMAMGGDTIVVAVGHYRGEGNRDIHFLGKKITLRSETGPKDCVIDCEGQEEDQHTGVLFLAGENADTVLDGFTIVRGWSVYGGGICCQGSSPTIRNCIIRENRGEFGGGVFCSESQAQFWGCTIRENISARNIFDGKVHGGGGVYGYRSDLVFRHCRICDNVSRLGQFGGNGGGIFFHTGKLILSHSEVSHNISHGEGGGLYCHSFDDAEIDNSMICHNQALFGGGLTLEYGHPAVTHCTIVGNSPGGVGGYGSAPEVQNSIIWGNDGYQVKLGSNFNAMVHYSDVEGGQYGVGNINDDPRFRDSERENYRLKRDSPCIDAGDPDYASVPGETDLDSNPRVFDGDRDDIATVDMGAYEFQGPWIFYVDASATGANDGSRWADAYVELQSALAEVEYGDQIWVAAGTYKPDYDPDSGTHTGDREATFQLIDGVAIYGGFPAGGGGWEERHPKSLTTILGGDLSGNDLGEPDDPSKEDNSSHVVTGSGTTATTVLDGVTITAGKEGTTGWYRWGAGMFIDQGSPTLINCTFTKNYGNNGGGLFIWNGSNPSLTHCDFIENYASQGGGIYNRESSPTITNCRFIGNTTLNSGAGMRNGGNSNPILTNCEFLGNSARIGGGAECYERYQTVSSPVFINCIFSGNRALRMGGGLRITANRYSAYGRPKLINCTLSGNTAGTDIYSGQGGGIMASGKTHVEIINSIVWGNEADVGSAVYVGGNIEETRMTFSHSNYGGEFYIGTNASVSWVGTVLQEDPLFIDADGGDNLPGTQDDNLRLLDGSGCINQGTNTTDPPLPATDLAGNVRIQDSTVDMGAYEGGYQGVILSAESLVVQEAGTESFTVRLAMEPANPIEVNVSRETGDPDITVQSGGILHFNSANYADPQTVILAAAADNDYLHGKAEIWVSHPDIFTGVVQVTEQDDDTPSVIYVDDDAPGGGDGTSWSNAFDDLQDALHIARVVPEVEEIRVGQGTYRPAGPGGDRSETFLLTDFENLAIQGGYVGFGATEPDSRNIQACTTILSGDLDNNDGPGFTHNEENSYHVLKGIRIDNSVVIDGFTITGGNANYGIWLERCGGGLANENSSLNISNCIFVRNRAESRGGGIYNQYSHENVPTYTNCIFRGNSAENGGGVYNRNSPILINCLFYGNTAHEDGGAIFNNEAFPTLLQCTLSGNHAGNQGGGMVDFDGAQSTLTNCILWGNADRNGMTESSQFYLDGGDPMINYSCIQEWSGVLDPEGVGNIDSDPCFVQPMYLAPISYWKFDEGSGTTAYDSTGSHHGTIYGGTEWVPGKIGGALRFGGGGDYVMVEHNPALNITGDLTISAWVYITQGWEYQAIVTKCVGSGRRDNPLDFRTDNGSEPHLAFVRADAVAHERVYSKVKMPLGQWHHVLVRVENNVPDFYVNGIITGKYADTIFTRTPTGNTYPLLIGRRDDGLSFNGNIDEVMIFNRALLMEEIQVLYHNDFSLSGDYHLRPGSPCIDAGADTEVYIDLEGNLRPFDYPGVDNNGALPEFDMGAYEFTAVEAEMKVTPQTLNCRTHGKWIKVHFTLPEGFNVSDVDVNTSARMEPLGIKSENLKVSTGGGDGLVKVEARFKRREFCAAVGSDWPEEIVVFGSFTSGESFYGTADVRIILPGLKEIAELSSRWLQTGCKKPRWCGGMDMNQDSVVNLRDFALLQNQTMEIVTK